ncbi:hypothetical protein LX36DRAFT_208735 [Colletotrichum falcatum]|nr:hypothetical protein LX36DRAFT_208735 [Colletotrichum falcatum]
MGTCFSSSSSSSSSIGEGYVILCNKGTGVRSTVVGTYVDAPQGGGRVLPPPACRGREPSSFPASPEFGGSKQATFRDKSRRLSPKKRILASLSTMAIHTCPGIPRPPPLLLIDVAGPSPLLCQFSPPNKKQKRVCASPWLKLTPILINVQLAGRRRLTKTPPDPPSRFTEKAPRASGDAARLQRYTGFHSLLPRSPAATYFVHTLDRCLSVGGSIPLCAVPRRNRTRVDPRCLFLGLAGTACCACMYVCTDMSRNMRSVDEKRCPPGLPRLKQYRPSR